MRVGITSPKFSIGWNTDLAIQKYFLEPGVSRELSFEFCGGARYSLSAITKRFLKRLNVNSLSPELPPSTVSSFQFFYCYGRVPDAVRIAVQQGAAKAILTTGVMTPLYHSQVGPSADPLQEVGEKDAILPPSIPFHFHTDYGRQKFQSICKTGRRAYAIPFFLPYLDDYYPRQTEAGLNISFVGRDGKRKGLYLLLEALKSIPLSELLSANICLTIISKDRPAPIPGITLKWKRAAGKAYVRNLLCNSHLYIMPTLYESYGIVFIEALAAGCTIIADCDSPRQEILSGSGIHVETSSPSMLASEIRQLMHTRSRIDEFSLKARSRYETHFAPHLVSRNYNDMFTSLREH